MGIGISRATARTFAVGMAVALALAVASCGGDDDSVSQEDLDAAVKEAKEDVSEQQTIEELQRKVREAKKGSTQPASSGSSSSSGSAAAGGLPTDAKDCGGGVYVRDPTTTCDFGLNVAADYYSSPSNTFTSFSPVTGEDYTMICSGTALITCTGGNNAAVYLP